VRIVFRIAGVVVGLAFIVVSIFMLLAPMQSDNGWQTFGKVSNILVGIIFVVYSAIGRRRFKALWPGSGKSFGE